MNSFTEELFPLDIAYGSEVITEFSTNVATSKSGTEIRNINWKHGRLKFNISYGVKSHAQLKALTQFFRSKKGKAIGFRFRDFSDFEAYREKLLPIAHGKYQLMKGDRIIQKPVENTVKIYLDDQEIEANINYTTGIVTCENLPPNSIIFADFCFDVPVRFDTDSLNVTNLSEEAFEIGNIYLIEIKL